MLRTIRVYGKLAKFLGKRQFKADVANAAEAVRFLVTNFPKLEPHMADQHYRVCLGEEDLGEEDLHTPAGTKVPIKIIPVVAGKGAVGRILLGVALIAAAFIFFPAAAGAASTLFGLSATGAIFFGVGASLVLGGVAQLLTPVPKINSAGTDSDNDPRRTYSFSGIQNTSRQGVPVPVIYGEMIVGSVVISAGIDVDQVAV